MIIDLILDRKDGEHYNPKDFYIEVMDYGEIGNDITRAMDSGTEADVKVTLCKYITENEYNPNICEYINGVKWIA